MAIRGCRRGGSLELADEPACLETRTLPKKTIYLGRSYELPFRIHRSAPPLFSWRYAPSIKYHPDQLHHAISKRSGITPITVWGAPSVLSVLPTIAGSPLNQSPRSASL